MSVKHLCRLAACAVFGLVCAPGVFAAQSVSINFIGGAGSNVTGAEIDADLTAGVEIDGAAVPGKGWNQVAQMSSTSQVSVPNYVLSAWNGTETESTLMLLNVSANNAYAYSGTAVTGNGQLMKGYLDDGAPSIVVSNIPYTSYDVYVYAGTDQTSSGKFEAITVNGTAYPNSDGSTWGEYTSTHESDGSITLTENTNYIKVSFSGDSVPTSVTIATYDTSSTANRIGLAGVQIVNTGDDVTYVTPYTRSFDASTTTGTWSDTTSWTQNGTTASTYPADGSAEITVAGATTLTVDAAVSLTSLTVGGAGSLTFAAGTDGTTLSAAATTVNTTVDVSAGVTTLGSVATGDSGVLKVSSLNVYDSISGTGALTTVGDDISVSSSSVASSKIPSTLNVEKGTFTIGYGQQTGFLNGRTINVGGGTDTAVLKFGTGDATGWSSSGGAINLYENSTLQVVARDTFVSTLTMRAGTLQLLTGSGSGTGTARAFDFFGSSNAIAVKQYETDPSSSNIAESLWTADDTTNSSASKINLRNGTTTITIDEFAKLIVDANLMTYADGGSPSTFTKAGLGTLVLKRANDFTNALTISAGTVQLADAGTLGTSAVTINSGATLDLASSGTTTLSNTITNNGGTITQTGSGTTTLSGTITNSGSVTVSGGALTISTLTNTGTLTVSSGTLTVPGSSAGNVTVASGATLNLQLTEAEATVDGFTISTITNNGGTVNLLDAEGAVIAEGVTTSEDGTISYEITNVPTWTNGTWSTALTDGGAAIIDFSSSTESTTCTLSDSSITSISVLTIKGTGTVNVNSALSVSELRLDDGDSATTSTVTFSNSAQLTVTGSVSGSESLVFSSGTVEITNAAIVATTSSYTGAVTLSGGQVNWGDNSGGTSTNVDYTFGSSLTINSGATFRLHPWTDAARNNTTTNKVNFTTPITLNGGTLKTEDGSYYFKGDTKAITVTADSTFEQGWDKGVLIGMLDGTGTLTWNAAMGNGTGGAYTCFRYASFTGKVVMDNTGTGASAWTVRLDSDKCFNSGELNIVDSTTTLQLGNNRPVGMLTGTGIVSGDYTLTINGISGGTTSGTFAGTITNTAIKLGDNSPNWTFTGSLGSSNTYSDVITLNSGSTLTLSPSAATTLSGTISGAGALVVDGSNAVTLTGYNTSFTGSTTVNSGATLKVLTTNYSVDDSYKALPDNHTITVNGTLDLSGFFGYVNITGTGTLQVSGTANLGYGSSYSDSNNSYNVATVTVDSGATLNFPTWRAATFSPTKLTVNGTITKASGDSALSMEVPSGSTWTLDSGDGNTSLPEGTDVNVLGTLVLDSGTSTIDLTGSGMITTKTGSSSYYVLGVTDEVTIAVENVVVEEDSNLGILDTSSSGKTITLKNLDVDGELKKADTSAQTPSLVLTGTVRTTTTDDTAGNITGMPVTFQNATLVITTYDSSISHIGGLQSVTFDGTLNVTMPSSSVSGSILSLASGEIAEPSAYNVTLATDGSALPYARVMASTIVKTDLLITNYQPSTEGTVSEVMKELDSGSLDKILDGAKTWALLYGSTTIESITGQTRTGTTGGTLGTTDINNALTVFDNIVTVTPTGSEGGSPLSAVVAYDFGISSMVVDSNGDIVVTAKVQGADAATAGFASGTTVTLTVSDSNGNNSKEYTMTVSSAADGTATTTVSADDLSALSGTLTFDVKATNTTSTETTTAE